MQLSNPFFISCRLMAAVKIGDATISIGYAKRPGRESRTRYEWFFDCGEIEETSDDLQSGNVRDAGIRSGMASLLNFMSACGESFRYAGKDGDNVDLFPESMWEWLSSNREELSMLAMEIDEDAGCCVE